ncbi:glycosyltransferase family 2 protein [uncultured Algibacter sp.]|uniref:glycosyltransferase family 2 protein n=1 Tax=uncultured Algibacter sp. TaxID=298659 RepID=UPI0026186EF7|nr:glycosyltransferase family 2 protein [uncultured Algibacter sp.]
MISQEPFFSVIIPLYNKENYIETTINSILKQSFKSFEIIIINDGSTDKSLEIAEITLADFSNYSIVSQKNKGLSAARNRGISSAKGKLIALIDADDKWHNLFLETIYNLYLSFPNASFYGTDYLEKYSINNVLETKKNISFQLKNKNFLIEDFFTANMFQPIICQSSMAFKRKAVVQSPYNEAINYAEDVEFYLSNLVNNKLAYHYAPKAIISYNIPDQITKIGIKNKTLPNLDFYQRANLENKSLLRYIDFKRYMYAIAYKLDGDKKNFNRLVENLNHSNLSFKQRILLNSPLFGLKLLKSIKKIFLKYNIRLTSFKS